MQLRLPPDQIHALTDALARPGTREIGRPQPGDKWYMDEVFIRIRDEQHYLWCAVDQDGNVLDILVQSRRSPAAATRFFRKLLKGLRYVPRVIVTGKLKSYAAAKRKMLPRVEHRQSRYLNIALRYRISRHDNESDSRFRKFDAALGISRRVD